jgi:hypothetical protein
MLMKSKGVIENEGEEEIGDHRSGGVHEKNGLRDNRGDESAGAIQSSVRAMSNSEATCSGRKHPMLECPESWHFGYFDAADQTDATPARGY